MKSGFGMNNLLTAGNITRIKGYKELGIGIWNQGNYSDTPGRPSKFLIPNSLLPLTGLSLGMAKLKRKKASKKEFILQKAAIMFRQKGFSATSMRDLAETVGIEAASLYNHIRSKNEILESICFEVANRFNANMDIIENGLQNSIYKVETLLRFHIQQMIHNYEEVYVCDREWRHLDEPYLSNFQNQRRTYRKRFAGIIEEGIRKNEIRKIDAPTAILIVMHAISGIESWHRSKARISAQELEDNMIMIMIDGLRKQG